MNLTWIIWQNVLDFLKSYKELIALVAVVPPAVWALIVFVDSQRKEASARLLDLFGSFYLKPELRRLRVSFDYDHDTKLRPVIEKLLVDPRADFDDAEKDLLLDLDTALNLLEFALYLSNRRLLSMDDRNAVFGYWYNLLRKPERAAMRTYLRCYDYGALTTLLDQQMGHRIVPAEGEHLVAFYGTLMKDGQGQQLAGINRGELNDCGACTLRGTLYDIGEYPGLVLTQGPTGDKVQGELYRVANDAALAKLDEYEGFESNDPRSEFVRRCVSLTSPPVDCWVYIYNHDLVDRPRIEGGNWSSYRSKP